jgi:hypothetical protein
MSDLITIPRSEWQGMRRAIEAFNQNAEANDLINREQACELLGITAKTFCNRKIVYEVINEHGDKFYSRKKLLGL